MRLATPALPPTHARAASAPRPAGHGSPAGRAHSVAGDTVSSYEEVEPARWTHVDTVAGLLATISIAASFLGLVYRPVRILPFAILLALIAAKMSARNERLAFGALAAAVVCWTLGMTIAVVTENALY